MTLADVHDSVVHLPCWTVAGAAVIDTVGPGGDVTVTVVETVREPPAPDAAIEYCVVTVGQTSRDPLGLTLPSPWSIEALVTLVEFQDSVAHLPRSMVTGAAMIDTVGAAGGGGGGGAGGATTFRGQSALARLTASLAILTASSVRQAQYVA